MTQAISLVHFAQPVNFGARSRSQKVLRVGEQPREHLRRLTLMRSVTGH